jgi:dihydropyrimidine dehydrogenase (NAD+) subunit PreT
LQKAKPNGKKVAIVGAGPAGLSAAATLAKLGYATEIYDERKEAGGYLRYGIPEYRLPNAVVASEVQRIADLGVKFHLGQKVDQAKLEVLKTKFDAVVLALGQTQGKTLPLFQGVKNVKNAVDFLAEVKTAQGKIALPKSVLVIGGGDVAMDTVTSLKLLGVPQVTDVVYETFAEFKASKKELQGAQKLGVSILDGYVPVSYERGVVGFKHRFKESTVTVKADLIILAVGQVTALGDLTDLVLDKGEGEDHGKIFLAGDIAHGEKTVVYAVRTGKAAAYAVEAAIGGK